MTRYLQRADQANVTSESTVVAIGARPTVTVQDGDLLPATVRDEGQEEWTAGNYRLLIYCVGEAGPRQSRQVMPSRASGRVLSRA